MIVLTQNSEVPEASASDSSAAATLREAEKNRETAHNAVKQANESVQAAKAVVSSEQGFLAQAETVVEELKSGRQAPK